MVKIRLKRVGRRHEPIFRIIAVQSTRGPKSGRHIEILGSYDPRVSRVQIENERVKYWLGVGAQVSNTVHNILIDQGILEGKKKNALPKKNPIIKENPLDNKPVETNTVSDKEKNKEDALPSVVEQVAEITKHAASNPVSLM
jgi:small subunit ribosomal protein S16